MYFTSLSLNPIMGFILSYYHNYKNKYSINENKVKAMVAELKTERKDGQKLNILKLYIIIINILKLYPFLNTE